MKYALKAQLVEELVKATREAVNAQATSPSKAQLILAFHLILKDWVVHPMHPNYPQDEKTPKVDALFRELRDAIVEQHEEFDNEGTRLAKELCRMENGDGINEVVMGFPNMTVPIAGKGKRLACLVYPLKPLWAHYIQDAINALAAIKKVREEKKNAV